MANYQTRPGTLYQDFGTLADWTIGGDTGATGVLDSVNHKTGANGLKLTTATGAAKTAHATRTISLAAANLGNWGFWIHTPNPDAITGGWLYLSSAADVSKYVRKWWSSQYDGWQFIVASPEDWANSGAESWANTMIRARLSVTNKNSLAAEVTFADLRYGFWNIPYLFFRFDDAYQSVIDVAYPALRKRGWRGTVSVVQDRVGTAGYMTEANLRTLYNAGWQLANHTKTHPDLTTLTADEMAVEIGSCQDYLAGLGFVRDEGHKCLVYSQGPYNAEVIRVAQSLGVQTALTTHLFPCNAQFGLPEPFRVPSRGCNASNCSEADADLSVVKGYVDDARNKGSICPLLFHNLVAAGAAGNDFLISDFNTIVDYIGQRYQPHQIRPWCEIYRGLSDGRRAARLYA